MSDQFTKQSGRLHVLLGYSGTGKSTISKLINGMYPQFKLVSTSSIVKSLGGNMDQTIKNGGLFSDENALRDLLSKELCSILMDLNSKTQILLDGFPRTVDQAEWLDKNFGLELGKFILLDSSHEKCIERLLGRKRTDFPDYDEISVIEKRLTREREEYRDVWDHIEHSHGYYVVDDDLTLEPVTRIVADILIGTIFFIGR